MIQTGSEMTTNQDSIMVCTYGPSGIGKTTDQGYSFPRALFVAAPGALSSIRSTCGYEPASTHDIKTILEATALLTQVRGEFEQVVIDDFSFMAEQTFSTLEKKYSGFKLWGKLRDVALEFRNVARFCGMDVILNCWEQGPKTRDDGTKVRGGPMLSGRLPEQIPAMCDVVLRAKHDRSRSPWPASYECSAHPSFVMKDRFNVASRATPCPMNLAEILRASGREVQRHPDLEANEEVVEAFTQNLQDADSPIKKANELYAMLLSEDVPTPVARWILRDAMDRHSIRTALLKAEQTFINTSGMIV
jgi:hypothetical protein